MVARVSRGNVIEFPLLTKEELAIRLITVKWSQSRQEREEQYYALVAKNKNGESGLDGSRSPDTHHVACLSADVDVPFFVQKNLYDLNESGAANGSNGSNSTPKPLSRIGSVQNG
jgi:hypothetical protein